MKKKKPTKTKHKQQKNTKKHQNHILPKPWDNKKTHFKLKTKTYTKNTPNKKTHTKYPYPKLTTKKYIKQTPQPCIEPTHPIHHKNLKLTHKHKTNNNNLNTIKIDEHIKTPLNKNNINNKMLKNT
jgi:hypothetical protein